MKSLFSQYNKRSSSLEFLSQRLSPEVIYICNVLNWSFATRIVILVTTIIKWRYLCSRVGKDSQQSAMTCAERNFIDGVNTRGLSNRRVQATLVFSMCSTVPEIYFLAFYWINANRIDSSSTVSPSRCANAHQLSGWHSSFTTACYLGHWKCLVMVPVHGAYLW